MADDFNIDDLRDSNTNRNAPDWADELPTSPARSSAQASTQPNRNEQSPAFVAFIVVLIVVAIICFCAGRQFAPAQLPHEAPVQPAATVTVTKTVTVVKEVPTIPDSCIEALDLAAHMLPLMEQITTKGGQTRDILSKARIAITKQDHQELIRLGNELHDAMGKTASATNELMELTDRYDQKIADCKSASGR